ncbi:MAG TPA: DHA2 family efflux MFS transporter permease subunit [Solirubrobacteraceae bacterium]|nr:DHA2 family efflux MFS transporter permease subunit [Solirubrobacteraceae bacterium]
MTQSARLLSLAAGAAFLALLDVTVVNLAVPALAREYPGTSVSSLSWVITAYATLFAALLAPAGRLADVVGRRTLFRAGVGGFALMSAACATAPSVPVLLAARALQGAAAAAMIPASLAIVLTDTPVERRMASIGMWSAAGAFAAAVGPGVGGVLVHAFGWRSLFVINVPTGVALAAFARIVPQTPRRDARLPDALGTVLLAVGVGLTALGLSQGARWGFGDARTLAALVGGVTAAVAALQRSRRVPVPAIETRLWRHRTFAFANATSLLYGTSLYAWMLLGVLVLTQLWHYSELQAGLAMTPGAIAASISAVLGGRVRGRTGPRAITVAGTLTMAACGLVLATTLPTHPDFLGYWLPIGLVLGTGMGLVTTGTSTAAALSLPASSFAAGTGLNQTARQVGGALGIATLATLIQASPSGGAATFEHVYLFCALVILCGAFVALGLTLRPVAAAAVTERTDPYLAGPPALDHSPWSRFVVVGDSMAEGIGDPMPGYESLGWADRVARALETDYLNLGRRNLLAAEVRESQLERALAFAPDLAAVLCGGNDLMQPDHDPVAVEHHIDAIVAALRAAGSDVIMFAPFDMSRSELLPADRRPKWRSLIERMSALTEGVARRHGAVLVDFRSHPAGPEPTIYSSDRIHLNARGQAICAVQTLRALEQFVSARKLRAA